MSKLDSLEVSNDLIWAVIEAAEADMDVEVLYPKAQADEQPVDSPAMTDARTPQDHSQARPINVHRLASDAILHFSKSGMPAGPATNMFFFSGIKAAPDDCFALELGTDAMAQQQAPSFEKGAILVFSSKEPVESGDLVYLKVRNKDLFAQVFFGKDKDVRIRFFNPAWAEQVAKRREIRIMYKLLGAYQAV